MNQRSFRFVLSAALILSLMFFVLALHAQSTGTAVANFQYDGVDPPTNAWIFSWDTVPGESAPELQAFSNSIADMWMGLYISQVRQSDNKTEALTGELIGFEDVSMQIRVRVNTPSGKTDWATTSYPPND